MDGASSETISVDHASTRPDAFETMLISGTLAILVLRNLPHVRNFLPEPFDLPDHIANFTTTTALLEGRVKSFFNMNETAHNERNKNRYLGGAVLAAVGLNIAGELGFSGLAQSVGVSEVVTADPTDFAYGILGGLAAFGLAQRKVKQTGWPAGPALTQELEHNNQRGMFKKFFARRKKTEQRIVDAIHSDEVAQKQPVHLQKNRKQRRTQRHSH